MKSGLALVAFAAGLLVAGAAHAQAPGAVPAGPPAAPPPTQASPPGYAPAPPPVAVAGGGERRGFTFGIGIGGGSIQCEDNQCDELETLSLNLHLGAMVRPRLAIAVDLWGNYHFDYGDSSLRSDEVLTSLSFASVVLRGWATPRLWFQGGISGATFAQRVEVPGGRDVENTTDTVAAVVFGVGYELLTSDRYSLDLSLRFGAGDFSDELDVDGSLTSGAFMVGFNWF